MHLETYKNDLSDEKLSEWNKLWRESPHANLFNSSMWLTSIKHLHQSVTIYFIYENSNLIAVLPFTNVRFFLSTIATSIGGRFLDKTPILMKEPNSIKLGKILSLLPSQNILIKELPNKILPDKIGTPALSSENPYLLLTDDPFSQFKKKKMKYIRNKIRNIGTRLTLVKIEDIKNSDLEKMFWIESHSPKPAQKRAIFHQSEARDLFASISKDYPLSRLYFINLDGELIAYLFGILNRKQTEFMAYNMAYLKDFRNYSPGVVLLFLLIDDLKDKGIRILDFSRGLNTLKSQFTSLSKEQYSLYIAKNTFFIPLIFLAIKVNQSIRYYKKHIRERYFKKITY